jgi:hypothetical protein
MKLIAKEDVCVESYIVLKGGKTYDLTPMKTWNKFNDSSERKLYAAKGEDGFVRHFLEDRFWTIEEAREMKLKDLGI